MPAPPSAPLPACGAYPLLADGDSRGRSRGHPHDLLALWNEPHGQVAFPLDDLVPAMRVADAFRIGA
jgi:hypothetical protein